MRNVQLTSDFTGGKPFWLVTYEQKKGLQASLLSQCRETCESDFYFHKSKIIDTIGRGQGSLWPGDLSQMIFAFAFASDLMGKAMRERENSY